MNKSCQSCACTGKTEASEDLKKIRARHMYEINWCNCKECKMYGKYAWCDDPVEEGKNGGCPYGSINIPC